MIKKNNITTGGLTIMASIGFFFSWFLMPDPGTTDTIHILSIVKQSRTGVMASIIVQIATSVLYLVALFLLAQNGIQRKRTTIVGIILLAVGLLGLCSDAFFHLLAYFMTDNSVTIQQDVVRVMDFMQTTGVAFLLPILLPFFIGSLVLAIGLNKQLLITRTSMSIIIVSFSIGILSAFAKKTEIFEPAPMIVTLGLFALGQAFIGLDLIKGSYKAKNAILAYQYQN
ncbi:MAG TPA: hypothetical protein VGQ53_07345 [Chitinophagaceae bacterium]|jgi:hypothetical protein|nr:hypothetical protein [Chitinophagaceae bacterium]